MYKQVIKNSTERSAENKKDKVKQRKIKTTDNYNVNVAIEWRREKYKSCNK